MNNTNCETTAVSTISVKKPNMKRPLTLVLAALFLLAAIIPVLLLVAPVSSIDNEDYPQGIIATEEDTTLSPADKIEQVAAAIEKFCTPDYTEDTSHKSVEEIARDAETKKQFFVTGTWVLFASLVASSLLMGGALILMYLSPSLSFNVRSAVMLSCVATAVLGIIVLVVMNIYSTIVLIGRISSIPDNMNLVDQKARDNATTESAYFILRNILITAGFAYYLYSLPAFALKSEILKKSPKKLARSAKSLSSAYTATALICCFFALSISLAWEFNFIAKALLTIFIVMGAASFAMTGVTFYLHKYLRSPLAVQEIEITEETA